MKLPTLLVCLLGLVGCHEKPAIQSSTNSTEKAPDKPEAKVDTLKLRGITKDGWTWQSPKPNAHPTLALYARSLDDFYAVGDAGLLLHFDKGTLQSLES